MSDSEPFIARWSRRKREAMADIESKEHAATPTNAVASELAPEDDRKPGGRSTTSPDRPSPTGTTFDPASLPSIESITAATDVRAFLAPGVPAELTRAALRRAWVADPAIRNFVGLAEYDWDFTVTDSMRGFGPLEMTEELRQEAARLLGQDFRNEVDQNFNPASSPEQVTPIPAQETQISARATQRSDESNSTETAGSVQSVSKSDPIERPDQSQNCDEPMYKANIASQHHLEKVDNPQPVGKRIHGRALPQ